MTELERLFREMADLTEPKCAGSCRRPRSCCSPEYCGMAMDEAAERGVELRPTGHPTLPLMGPNGCVAPPHLRPLCTLHLCSIAGMGTDPEPGFDERYFDLRNAIMEQIAHAP